MDISKKRIKEILIFLLLFSFAQAQNWEAKLSYNKTDSTEILSVYVMPDYAQSDTFLIDFLKPVLIQNSKEDIEVWTLKNDLIEKLSVVPPFTVINGQAFSYEIDLLKSHHIPSKAYLNYGSIQVANWQEILFYCNPNLKLNLVLEKETKIYELGVKRLIDWKLSPSKILPTKALTNVNKINVATNLSSKELKIQLEQALKPFNYLDKATNVVLIFANDSMETCGVTYPELSIVYVDAKTSLNHPDFTLQHTLLHELFHKLVRYNIRPEREAEALAENWLAEAAPEYFSLRFQLIHQLMTETEFMAQMEQKLRMAKKFDGNSLYDMSLNIYRNASYYDAFYSKGCIALFLADLDLYRASKGEFMIGDLIIGKFPDLNEEQQGFISTVLYDLDQSLIANSNQFALNKYLEAYGWEYKNQIVLPGMNGMEIEEIRNENIVENRMINAEQKALWKGFTTR